MKKKLEPFLMSAIGLLVVLALPLAYRIWLSYHPAPERKPLSAVLEESIDARRETLLMTPLGSWSEADRRSAPDIHAWLEQHGSVILPWEWTEEAKKKDRSGYRAIWRRLLDEQLATVRRIASRMSSAAEESERRSEQEGRQFVHLTNQLFRLEGFSTNAFPCRIEVEKLVPGRFWGWNRVREAREFDSREALLTFAEQLRATARDRERSIADCGRAAGRQRQIVAGLEELAQKLLSVKDELATAGGGDSGGDAAFAAAGRLLLESISTGHRLREALKDGAPGWIPGKVLDWFAR